MKRTLSFTALIAISTFFIATAVAQESAFDKEIKPWHKKAVMTCGMLRDMKTFDQQKMLSNLDELSAELTVLQSGYGENPPKEYANDPLWKNYFEDFADNLAIVKERVEKKQYRLVQNYCGNFCRIFGRMHKNNGRTDLTDLMFSLRMEIMGRMEMLSADNSIGAKENLAPIKNLLSKVVEKANAKGSKEFDKLFEPLRTAADTWLSAMEKADKPAVKESVDNFMNAFPKAYGATL